jgi:hypothetical protein
MGLKLYGYIRKTFPTGARLKGYLQTSDEHIVIIGSINAERLHGSTESYLSRGMVRPNACCITRNVHATCSLAF